MRDIPLPRCRSKSFAEFPAAFASFLIVVFARWWSIPPYCIPRSRFSGEDNQDGQRVYAPSAPEEEEKNNNPPISKRTNLKEVIIYLQQQRVFGHPLQRFNQEALEILFLGLFLLFDAV